MHLPSGIPTLPDLDALKQTDLYARHVQFNCEFLQKHNQAMQEYGRHWGMDPFKLWSRRWEYPYVAERLLEFAANRGQGMFRVLDAGSGVTYFPYFILNQIPRAEFVCCDYDPSYSPMFERINADRGGPKVRFVQCMLQEIPLNQKSLDAICCISVLEHTDNYGVIIREFARVLDEGGKLVLTFDLSLDGKFTLSKPLAMEMLGQIEEIFDFPNGFEWRRELERMTDTGILSSDHVQRTEPELLPWSFPVRVYKAVQDLVRGKGWTTGFRSRTVFCLEATKKKGA